MLTRIKGAVSSAVRGVRGKSTAWSISGNQRHRSEYEILRMFGENSRFGSPVDAIATDVSMVQWFLEKRTSKGSETAKPTWQQVHDHDALRLWERPHPRLPGCAWRYVTAVHWLTCGYAPSVVTERDSKGRPSWITPIAPHQILDRRPYLNNAGQVVFRVNVNDKYDDVKVEDLLWPFRVDPLDPTGAGLGKAAGIDDEISLDESMAKFLGYYFKNSAFLGAVVNVPNADLDTLAKEFKQERVGIINAHRPLLTNSEQAPTIAHMTPSMKDLAMESGRRMGRDFMLQQYHVSPERVGILENSSRGTIEGSDFHQQKYCTLPILVYMRDFFNQHLIAPNWGDEYRLGFINPVKETAEFRRLLADTGIRGGWLTINEAREFHDVAPIKGGDMLLIPVNNVIMLDVSKGIDVPSIEQQLRLNRNDLKPQGGN